MCQVHCKALGMAYEIRLCSQNVQSVVKEQKNKSMVFFANKPDKKDLAQE